MAFTKAPINYATEYQKNLEQGFTVCLSWCR